MKKLIYQGSVKDIYEIDNEVIFNFTDYYSIFDWGRMPDQIDKKGQCLAHLANFFFTRLSRPFNITENQITGQIKKIYQKIREFPEFKELNSKGMHTHFIKQLTHNEILVERFQTIKPVLSNNVYSYEEYKNNNCKKVIPLEVVFRLGATTGSSILNSSLKDFQKLQQIESEIKENEFFDNISIEFFSKFEAIDRLLTYEEAKNITNLNEEKINELTQKAKVIALKLYIEFSNKGYTLWDGKLEFGIDESQKLILVDSIGPDELRLKKGNKLYSKEILRQSYKDSLWCKELNHNKEKAPNCAKKHTINTPNNLSSKCLLKAKSVYEEILEDFKPLKKVVIFGKGAREHALAKNIILTKNVSNVTIIPGSNAISDTNITSINIEESDYVAYCKKNIIDLVIIGPEDLLEKGLTNKLKAAQINVFAPTQKASLLETSKIYSKNLMNKNNIPTAMAINFNKKEDALTFVQNSLQQSFVIKQSGPAAGKGVFICNNKTEALESIQFLFKTDNEILIEELLVGKELSFFAICLNDTYKILGHACDYKRLLDNNRGPNTGGMGCYSPASWVTEKMLKDIESNILKPTLSALKAELIPFTGVLFIGLIYTQEGFKVLEYNTRFGDPETQTILPLYKESLFELLYAAATNNRNKFNQHELHVENQSSVHIVKASKGYPDINGDGIKNGFEIQNSLTETDTTKVFFAGVKADNKKLFTNGGRVLGVTQIASNTQMAIEEAYKNINKISFSGEQFRKDIGQ